MFNINTSEIVAYTNKLEKMHRSDLPVAVRGALNDAAFHAKKTFIGEEFSGKFQERKRNFIRSHTAFNKSTNTFDLDKMKSEAGVIKGKSEAGDDLEKQEFGGTIANREYIAMDFARAGGSKAALVSRRFYIKKIKPKRVKKRTRKQQFVKAAFKAGKGGFIHYGDFLFKIRSIKKPRRGKLEIDSEAVHSFEQDRSVTIKKAPFIKPAGEKAAALIPEFYIKQAERRIYK